MLKKKKFLISGVILICALVYLLYLGFGSATVYYLTVSEILGAGDSIYAQSVRVNGKVVPGSINSDSINLDYSFAIADEGGKLTIVYHGVMPDGFVEGADLVVQGKIKSDHIFYATTILAKCPSKYEPKGSG